VGRACLVGGSKVKMKRSLWAEHVAFQREFVYFAELLEVGGSSLSTRGEELVTVSSRKTSL